MQLVVMYTAKYFKTVVVAVVGCHVDTDFDVVVTAASVVFDGTVVEAVVVVVVVVPSVSLFSF